MAPHRLAPLAAILLTVCLPLAARAQRPVITESIDEPARSPFQQSNAQLRNTAYFDAVPAGKRLVITYVSGSYSVVAGTTDRDSVEVSSLHVIANVGAVFGPTLEIPVFRNPDSVSRRFFSSPVVFYVEAGSQPIANANASPDAQNITLTGYFVSVP